MKFGVFLPNGSNGYMITSAVDPYPPTWDLNLATTLEAERQGLDFVLSMMKFRGFGGVTGYWDACMESFTLMGALAARTSRIGLVPTAAILALHPAYTARMMATLDDVSGGRAALNIVTGWNKAEYVQMGLWKGDDYYGRRYEYAADYVSIMRELWREGRVTRHSEFFDLEDCRCYPTPAQDVPLVSAGQSPAGQAFVAAVGAHNFVFAPPEKLPAITGEVRRRAAAAGSRAGTYALFHLVAAKTDAEAWDLARAIVAGADLGAIRTMVGSASLDTVKEGTTAQLAQHSRAEDEKLLAGDVEVSNMAFMGFPAIVGSWDTVAKKIDRIGRAAQLDGMLFSWPDWVSGIRAFGEEVIPRLECRRGWDVDTMGGLRGPGRSLAA